MGGRGPDVFDCWGLVTQVYRDRLSVNLPEFAGVTNILTSSRMINEGLKQTECEWARLNRPVDMCLVAMGRRCLSHVGIFLKEENGLVLHAYEDHKVCVDNLSDITRILGFGRVEFYHHRELPSHVVRLALEV
jgi:cell wall-associated NlpC family hydrolase